MSHVINADRSATQTTRFAIIESHTGYVWSVVNALSPVEACGAMDLDISANRDGEGQYQAMSESDIRSGKDGFFVHVAPEGFDVLNGQDEDAIAAVQALPRAGIFGWVHSD